MKAFLDASEDKLPTVSVERVTYGKPYVTIGELAGVLLSEQQLEQLVAALVRGVCAREKEAA